MQTNSVNSSAANSLIPSQIPADKLKESIAQLASRLTGTAVDATKVMNLSLSEDLLYASIVHQRLEEQFPGTGSRFIETVATDYRKQVKNESRQPLTRAVDTFLNTMVTKRQLTAAKRDSLIQYAFGKAQLDDRGATLARTPKNPTTRQTPTAGNTMLDSILQRVTSNDTASRRELEAFDERLKNNPQLTAKQVRQQANILDGIFPQAAPAPTPQTPAAPAPSSETDKAGPVPDPRTIVTGPNDFAYKPESELDGKMVVMVPSRYRDRAVNASIFALDGEKKLLDMQAPRYGDDQRPYFRSDRSGKDLEGAAIVRVNLVDGSRVDFPISDLRSFDSIAY